MSDFFSRKTTVTVEQMFSGNCPYNAVSVDGDYYYYEPHLDRWFRDSTLQSRVDSLPVCTDPQNLSRTIT